MKCPSPHRLKQTVHPVHIFLTLKLTVLFVVLVLLLTERGTATNDCARTVFVIDNLLCCLGNGDPELEIAWCNVTPMVAHTR